MLWNFVKPILIFIPLAVIQLVVLPLFSIDGISPNLIVILICYFTLKFGQMYGTFLGFVLGLLLDLISGGLIGSFMFSFTVTGFLAGYFFNENKIEINVATYVFLIVVSLCGIVSSFLYTLISSPYDRLNILSLILEAGILPGLYTAFFALPIVIFSSKRELG
ncbi:MAG: rod shape-determining protein MreD [Melioribacter sp.]|nr:rod shape-determining protein MreD [Melioribacter sp.]